MGFYKLNSNSSDLSDGKLLRAEKDKIDYEESFECWLENSPDVLFEDSSNTVIWIGRQETIDVGEVKKFPDLIGVDGNGDIIIVELKKGRTSREVIAQILEYSSWAVNLTYEDMNLIYKKYKQKNNCESLELSDEINKVFNPDNENITVVYNKNQKLFIVAEEISPIIIQVVNYLRNKNINLFCIEYTVHKTEQGDIFIKTDQKILNIKFPYNENPLSENIRWNENIKVKDAVFEAVSEFTKMDKKNIFSPLDIYKILIKKYPNFNRNTLNCQLIADSVNHTSRKHYLSGQEDRYFWIESGKYRIYDNKNDGEWNKFGEKIN